MSSLNLFEVAGSIAGIAGISLVVFYFLFQTIIKNTLPDLTRNAKKNIIVLMLFMVWSVTIIGMTTWIYANTSNDGGKQPGIESVDDAVVNEEEAKLSLSYAGTIALSRSLKSENTLIIPSKVGFDYVESPPDRNGFNNICELKLKSSLWMSFNERKPYYELVSKGKIKIILNKLDTKQDKATFKLYINDTAIKKEYLFTLNKQGIYSFSFNGCNYIFSYKGMTKRELGLQYWFKTRYIAHYEISPMG